MIMVDPFIDNSQQSRCLAYAAADVLQRAGYSVWPAWYPDVEGVQVLIFPDTRASSQIGFTGGLVSPGVSVTTPVQGAMTLHDVRTLVAKLVRTPAFRQIVATSERPHRFKIRPIDQKAIRSECGDEWLSSAGSK